jgi:uncharacterized protein
MPAPLSTAELKTLLCLEPHPREGGWFRQTWRASEILPASALPARYMDGRDAGRSAGTAIYYLLEPDAFSEMHRLASDEVFHFYLGDPVEMLQLFPDGTGRTVVLGSDVAEGQLIQTIVPQGVWQGSRLLPGGKLALLGCTVSPGFEYVDYETGTRAELTASWAGFAKEIDKLTRG